MWRACISLVLVRLVQLLPESLAPILSLSKRQLPKNINCLGFFKLVHMLKGTAQKTAQALSATSRTTEIPARCSKKDHTDDSTWNKCNRQYLPNYMRTCGTTACSCSNIWLENQPNVMKNQHTYFHTWYQFLQKLYDSSTPPLQCMQQHVLHSHTRAPCSQSKTFTHQSPLLTEQNIHTPEPLAHRAKHSQTRAPCSQSKTFTHQSPLLTE